MSVTFHLYRVRDDVKYNGSLEEQVNGTSKNEELLDALKRKCGKSENFSFYELAEIEDSFYPYIFSDGNNHAIMNINHIKAIHKGKRGLSRLLKKLKHFNVKKHTDGNGQTFEYLILDEEVYRQGWFLKRRFFHKGITTVICVTKEEMQNFFNRYIDYNNCDTHVKEVVNTFLDKWEPGMLFECCW